MMQALDRIIDKVRKLLALAHGNGATAAEAAAAAAAAQHLMERHRIAAADVDAVERDEEIGEHDALWSDVEVVDWLRWLGAAVTRTNDCRGLIRWRTERSDSGLLVRRFYYTVVGRASDVTTVRYLFAYLRVEIDRLTAEALFVHGERGAVWEQNFRRGCVQEIQRKLERTRREGRYGVSERALVHLRQRDEAVQAFAERIAEGVWNGRVAPLDSAALWHGRAAGASINVEPGAPLEQARLKLEQGGG